MDEDLNTKKILESGTTFPQRIKNDRPSAVNTGGKYYLSAEITQ